jgi:hypothetical protein
VVEECGAMPDLEDKEGEVNNIHLGCHEVLCANHLDVDGFAQSRSERTSFRH